MLLCNMCDTKYGCVNDLYQTVREELRMRIKYSTPITVHQKYKRLERNFWMSNACHE